MPIAPIPQEQYEEVQAQLRKELMPHLEGDQIRPAPANMLLVKQLGTDTELWFRGRRFRVPPVGFKDGAELSEIETKFYNFAVQEKRLAALKEGGDQIDVPYEMLKDQLELMEKTVALFRKLVRPWGAIERLLWPFLSNPFEAATETEVGQLLGFFWSCRRKSGVRFTSVQRMPDESPRVSI
jgi:hypothetical protein